jgi:pimeloyl-ACP methyl ester carboxylesterase
MKKAAIPREENVQTPVVPSTVCRSAKPDDVRMAHVHGWGQESRLSLNLKVHPNESSGTIVMIYPGHKSHIDGYNREYETIARELKKKGVGAAVQVENRERHGFVYANSVIDDLKAAVDHVILHASEICGQNDPVIYLMGVSAGAAAVAAVAGSYPQIEKILLIAPSGDAEERRVRKSLASFPGKVFVVVGEQDEVVGVESAQYFMELAIAAEMRKLVTVPKCDHGFRSRQNGIVLSKAPFWAFRGDDSFPSPEGGIVLY